MTDDIIISIFSRFEGCYSQGLERGILLMKLDQDSPDILFLDLRHAAAD